MYCSSYGCQKLDYLICNRRSQKQLGQKSWLFSRREQPLIFLYQTTCFKKNLYIVTDWCWFLSWYIFLACFHVCLLFFFLSSLLVSQTFLFLQLLLLTSSIPPLHLSSLCSPILSLSASGLQVVKINLHKRKKVSSFISLGLPLQRHTHAHTHLHAHAHFLSVLN